MDNKGAARKIFISVAGLAIAGGVGYYLYQQNKEGAAKTKPPGTGSSPFDTAMDKLGELAKKATTDPEVGKIQEDGTVYAGRTAGGKKLYTTARDAPLRMTFGKAVEFARAADLHGHNDWRLPTRDEQAVLYKNRKEIGNFNTSGASPAGCYRSTDGKPGNRETIVHNFGDGKQATAPDYIAMPVRLVRTGPKA